MKILITGGAGFIGSALVRYILDNKKDSVINIDKLTYAGNLDSIPSASLNSRYDLIEADICDKKTLDEIFRKHKPNCVMHLAAESHVDRSIDSSEEFILTNILGTYRLLEQTRSYYEKLNDQEKEKFKFHHISTDEVYGDLQGTDDLATENTRYAPSSPYSASKASSDHLVRAWFRTYNLPILITNCSNNYGPYQFPEKLIPHVILNALSGKQIPVYGDGLQVRDWLFVEDHVRALLKVLTKGSVGETYNIGGHNQKTNIEVVESICELLEELTPEKPKGVIQYRDLITYVKDRPGHDTRYAIDASKVQYELDLVPEETFDTGLRKTVQWYLDNREWWKRVLSGTYRLERISDGQ